MAASPTAGADADIRWMRVALGLAARALGRVAPNPAVGALVVRDGRVLGRGITGDGGRPHAEAVALTEASRRWGAGAARGATVYVTLEPCNHQGRTPPCTRALIEAGVARLVAPIEDPDPRVSGRGFAALRAAGIKVEVGPLAAEARRLNAGFLSVAERGRPWVMLKLAQSLDGRIATAAGESRWITGPLARRRVHLMRARADGILVGAATARIDDPLLDVRLPGLAAGPVRIVLDTRLELDPTSRLVCSAARQPVWVLHGAAAPGARREALAEAGVDLLEVPEGPGGRLELAAALAALAGRGLTRLLVEGGGAVAAALIGRGLVDEIALFSAGQVIGGDGRPAIAPLGLSRLADAPGFVLAGVEEVAGDVLTHWRRPPA